MSVATKPSSVRNPFEADFEEFEGIFAPRERDDYRRWLVTIRCTDLILGGSPKNPDTLMSWLKSRFDEDEDIRAKLIEHVRMKGVDTSSTATIEDVWENLKELGSEQHGNGFLSDDRGIFVPARCMKSAIKEAANTRFAGETWGPGHTKVNAKTGETETTRAGFKGVLRVVAERVYVLGSKLYVQRREPDGSFAGLTEPDGTLLHIGHPDGPRGRVSNLTYFDYCQQPWFTFTLQAAENFPSDDQIMDILTEAQFHGLWAGRSMGYGQFRVMGFERL